MYKIGEVAKMTGLKTHTIRFWNKKFPHIVSVNNKSHTRYYDSFAISEFVKIKNLMTKHGMTLAGIEKMVKDGKIKTGKLGAIVNIAQKNLLFSPEAVAGIPAVTNVNRNEAEIIIKNMKNTISEIKNLLESDV